MEKLHLTDLLDVDTLQRFQSSFSEMTGIAAVVADANGVPVTEPTCFSRFCMDIVRQSPKGKRLCEECDKLGGQQAMETGRPAIYTCHGGLVDFAAPLIVGGRFLGSVMGGQVLGEAPEEKHFREIAKNLDINPDRFMEAARHIHIVSKDRMDALANFLFLQADLLSNLAYNNYKTRLANRELEKTSQQKTEWLNALERQYNENQGVLNALAETYLTVYSVDLESDTYKTVRNFVTELTLIPPSGPYTPTLHRYCQSVVHPDDIVPIIEAGKAENIAESLSGQNPFYEMEYRRLYGQDYQWLRLQFIPLETKDGIPVKVIMAVQNIDVQKKQEAIEQQALKDACDAANKANAAKTHFLSCMSHDIRTPLNVILGMNHMAGRHIGDGDRVKKCLESISVSSSHLLTLVNEILDMSRIESGNLTLTEEAFDFESVIGIAREMIGPFIAQKQHRFTINTDRLVHKNVIGDAPHLQQILQNLLSNAVKYTASKGEITLNIRDKTGAPPGYANIEIRVADNGYGMSKDIQSRIFEPFERGNDTRINKIQGTGLGLTITRNLVQLMNGDIQLESEPGKGTTFTVSIPFRIMEGKIETKPAFHATRGKRTFTGKRALLVEDNELNMEIAVEFLKLTGIDVDTAENGQVALEKIRQAPESHYDIVFMDIQMPVMNGHEATRAIRDLQRPDTDKLPIVALTANAFIEDIAKSTRAGMTAHIAKPLDQDKIHDVMDQLL